MERRQRIIAEWEEWFENRDTKAKYKMIKVEDGSLESHKVFGTEFQKGG